MSELCRKISWGFPTYKAKKNCKHSHGPGREEDSGHAVPENMLPDGREQGSDQRAALAVAPLRQDNRAGDGAGGGRGGGHVVLPPLRAGLLKGAGARKGLAL